MGEPDPVAEAAAGGRIAATLVSHPAIRTISQSERTIRCTHCSGEAAGARLSDHHARWILHGRPSCVTNVVDRPFFVADQLSEPTLF